MSLLKYILHVHMANTVKSVVVLVTAESSWWKKISSDFEDFIVRLELLNHQNGSLM